MWKLHGWLKGILCSLWMFWWNTGWEILVESMYTS